MPGMSRKRMEAKWQERLDFLSEIELPESLEWADKNLPTARPYIEKTYTQVMEAINAGNEYALTQAMERYEKAWVRVWQLMAEEHYKTRDFMDADLRYYRHAPDGWSFVLDSSVTGGEIVVFPRKPKKPPKDKRWMTAGEAIKMHENPLIMRMVKEFGAWFSRDSGARSAGNDAAMKAAIEASKAQCKAIAEAGKGLKFKKKKHGADWYE